MNQRRRLSEEHKDKISKTLMGHKLSEETKVKISKAMMGHTHNLGHKCTKETKAKMSKAQMGNTSGAKPYPSFISPDGTVYPSGINLKAFCREHDLAQSSMCAVKNGKQKHHRGWILHE